MKALSRDLNWLKLIGIIVVLCATTVLSRCSQGFTQRSQVNAPLLVRSICLEQASAYKRAGHFIENLAAQGKFPNPYPEFYTHSTRYEANRVFHYATSKSPYLKSYVGLVVGLSQPAQSTPDRRGSTVSPGERSAIAIVCEAVKPSANPASDPSFGNSRLACGSHTQQVGALLTL